MKPDDLDPENLAADGDTVPEGVAAPTKAELKAAQKLFKDLDDKRR